MEHENKLDIPTAQPWSGLDEKMITAVMDASRDLMIICDNDGRIKKINRACEKLIGCSDNEAKENFIWNLANQEEAIKIKELFQYGASDRYENHIITPNGERRHLSWIKLLLGNDEKNPSYVVYIGQDITQLRIMKKRLHQSEAELQSILENANGIIYTLSPEGRLIYVSRGWTETLGHEIDEVQGQIFDHFIHPDSIMVCRKFFNQIVTDGGAINDVEYQVRHRDGTWRWHSSSGAPILDETGKPLYYVGLAVDITERKMMESSLRLSEEKFSKAFHGNPDPITITSLNESQYMEVNDAWVEITGFTRSEAIGRTSVELGFWVEPEKQPMIREQIIKQGSVSNFNAIFRMKSGEQRHALVSVEKIEMEGKPCLICVHKDITELNRSQEALKASEELFSKAFNASPTTMSITTMQEGKFINVNERFCSVVGYSNTEISGRTSLELGFWIDPADRAKVIQRIKARKPVRDMEIIFRRQWGDHRLGLYSAEKIDINGEQCLLSIVIDITERKEAEEKIKYLSFYDKLTGLYNRAFFEEELKRLDTSRNMPLSLIMGDVNGLKLINDALGHWEGDKLLITLAEILKKSCRQEDCIARWGGDEFIVLLPGCNETNAARVFERIKKCCQSIDNFPIQTSISLGMATKRDMSRDFREVIKEAEDKMYRNKLLESRSARSTFLTSLEKTLWSRSHETKEHCQRLQEIAQKIGQALNLPNSEMDNLKLLAALHDIGKIAIPNNILENPGKLSPEDWETMKKHPEIGYRIALSSPEMAPVAEAILTHHERWDGTGYPLGLKADAIPLISRIIAIVDTYDVMINGRPYQKAVSKEEALYEIDRCAGSQFDPDLAQKSIKVFLEANSI